MDHQPVIRPVAGADTAVLFLHGIVGTPRHFDPLLPLVPGDWSVYDLLLEGHGGTVRDFGRTSMAAWKAQASAAAEDILAIHKRLYICAHSMGCLFAINAALAHPDRVAGLFLLAVPLRIRLPPATVAAALTAALGRAKPGSTAMAMVNDSSVKLTPDLFAYLPWLPRFWELLREAARVRKLLPNLTVPTCCFQSEGDELVSRRSEKHLTAHPHITLSTLPHSGHFAYSAADLARMKRAFRAFLAPSDPKERMEESP